MVDSHSGKEILAAAGTGVVRVQFSGGKHGKSLCTQKLSTGHGSAPGSKREDPWEWEHHTGVRTGKRKRLEIVNSARLIFWSPELPPPSTESYFALELSLGNPQTAAEATAEGWRRFLFQRRYIPSWYLHYNRRRDTVVLFSL